MFASRGAVVVDHDILAREAVAPGTAGLASIAGEFGTSVINDDSTLNRAALGAIVFSDADKLAALNAIVHPEVKRLGEAADLKAREEGKIVIHDIPLLVETTQEHDFDAVVVVEAPLESRIQRMVENRGMSRADALARINNQASDEARRSIADHLIENDGTLADLELRVQEVWQQLLDARDVSGSR